MDLDIDRVVDKETTEKFMKDTNIKIIETKGVQSSFIILSTHLILIILTLLFLSAFDTYYLTLQDIFSDSLLLRLQIRTLQFFSLLFSFHFVFYIFKFT